jgi:hypothetical protein
MQFTFLSPFGVRISRCAIFENYRFIKEGESGSGQLSVSAFAAIASIQILRYSLKLDSDTDSDTAPET